MPFGDDMKFQNANKQYSNMDRLIKRINERFDEWNVDVRYGTLGDYFKMINIMSFLKLVKILMNSSKCTRILKEI